MSATKFQAPSRKVVRISENDCYSALNPWSGLGGCSVFGFVFAGERAHGSTLPRTTHNDVASDDSIAPLHAYATLHAALVIGLGEHTCSK